MAAHDVVELNETLGRLEVPQSGDTYNLPRDVTTKNITATGNISASGQVLAGGVAVGALASGTATAVGALTITDSLKAWAIDVFAGSAVVIYKSGSLDTVTNIDSNTASILTLASGSPAPDSGTAYAIYTRANMLASTYDPAAVAEQLVGLTATQTLSNKTLAGAAFTGTITQQKAANIASAATLALPADGNTVHVTGTATITDFTVPAGTPSSAAGPWTLIADAAWSVTHSAGIIDVVGGSSITMAAGDVVVVWQDGTTFRVAKLAAGGGTLVQEVFTETGAVATGTTTIPSDDTIPQNTEGDQFMSRAITPTSASNNLDIDVVVLLSNSAANNWLTTALFKDSGANAIASAATFMATSTGGVILTLHHRILAGSTSSQTFKIRAGGSVAGTSTFNGKGGNRLYGGVISSSIRIREVTP